MVGFDNKTNTQRSAVHLHPVVPTKRRARGVGGKSGEKKTVGKCMREQHKKKHKTQDDEGIEDERVS